jgi:RNA recognition motif-containing protein
LFVGNISNTVRQSDIEKYFEEFGECRVKFKGSYSFVEYDKENDADNAYKNLQNKKIGGREINIEWSKQSGKFDPSKSRKGKVSNSPRRQSDRSEIRCYTCNSMGHYARECRDGGSSKYSRRRSRSRSRSKSRSRSRNRNKKHREKSRSRDRHRSRSNKKKSKRSRSKSEHSRDKDTKKKSNSRNRSYSKYSSSSKKSSKKDDRSPEKDNKKEKSQEKTNGDKEVRNISPEKAQEKTTENNVELKSDDLAKLKVDELKAELTKYNVTFSKNAKKQELLDLLKQQLNIN